MFVATERTVTPIEDEERAEDDLDRVRDHMERLLMTGELSRLAAADTILEYVRNEEVPTHALLELISFVHRAEEIPAIASGPFSSRIFVNRSAM